ncbi:hypothetical protein FACS189459_1980 [Bacilli bacterium]|nr:hypothetical protein FACS189459_1980 [Bacilli bacterium]
MAIMSIAIPQSNMTKNIDPKQLAPRILIMYYGQMTGFFIMIYTIITANSLVASQVDRGSMAYTLSTPIKRTKVTITQMIYLITALFTMTMLVAIVNIICFSFGHNLSLDIEDVLLMAAGCFLLQVTIASISFMASCIFNLSKFSFSLGAGIPVAFYLFSILSQISGLEFLRFFTIFTLFDVGEVKMGQGGMVTDG